MKRRYKYKKDVQRIEEKATKLDEQLSRMENFPRKYEIASGELGRRRGLLTRLNNEVASVSSMLARGRQRIDRDELDLTAGVEESLETRHLSNQQLMERQQREELKQDEHLEDILRGVTTLKDMGYGIAHELNAQEGLLDNLEQGIDKTDRNIQRNTSRVQNVSHESTSCWPMFIMIFLFFIIVFLLLT